MATGTVPSQATTPSAYPSLAFGLQGQFWRVMHWLGSLKIAVAMFAASILILLVGTLAQDEESIVDVKRAYFNSWVAMIDADVFFPKTIFPHEGKIPFRLPFPGGATIGLILMINLFAAKLTRFALNAKGSRLILGLLITAFGAALLSFVIMNAHSDDGVQGEVPIPYEGLWWICKGLVWASAVAAVIWMSLYSPKHSVVKWSVRGLATSLLLVSGFLIFREDLVRIPDPGLRIVWQLGRSTAIGLVLLGGLVVLFGKRGGNVLIHIAVAMLMLGQFAFGDRQIEERMTLAENQTSNLTYQIENVELAVIDSSDPSQDQVVAIDAKKLVKYTEDYLSHETLPIEFRVVEWFRNSSLVDLDQLPSNLATKGVGLEIGAQRIANEGGTSDRPNVASAYLHVRDKRSREDLGTYLVSQIISDDNATSRPILDTIDVGNRSLKLSLRFRHTYKPYFVNVRDVQRIDYSGTATPQDYSSFIAIQNDQGELIQEGRVWMNNPVRFSGETFYQSGYVSAEESFNGKETTTLQVVRNAGWLMPYVACMLAAIGMLFHFGVTFVRFAGRYDRNALKAVDAKPSKSQPVAIALGILTAIVAVIYAAKPQQYENDEFDWASAGRLPVQYEGRIKPADSAARHIMQALHGKQKGFDDQNRVIPAVHWLFAAMADQEWLEKSPVFRIDADPVLAKMNLSRRMDKEQKNRYSYYEMRDRIPALRESLKDLPRDSKKWNFEQRKLAELEGKIRTFELLIGSYRPNLPETEEDLMPMARQMQMLTNAGAPAILPPLDKRALELRDPDEPAAEAEPVKWLTFAPAVFGLYLAGDTTEFDREPTKALAEILEHLRANEPRKFNAAITSYEKLLAERPVTSSRTDQVNFEAFYNKMQPVYLCAALYVVAFIAIFVSFIVGGASLRSFAFWLILGTFLIHTFAIGARMYISERPPVVSLYSSAVFIGWAIVLFGLAMERLYPLGVASVVASASGFLTLLVAYGLDQGDTMPVLQAVLDTQFWLATHVVCISLGYSVTFLAGALGIAWLGWSVLSKYRKNASDPKPVLDVLYRLCYGSVCFAIFFSFVGTVLGGLWGDDSWGRFWGWDPKENGALMIVMWNALLLHARWDKMVGARGFSLLSIGGNIVTAWSWFGVNQLSIGLHSYGFTEAALAGLTLFVGSQIAILLVAGFLTRSRVESKIETLS